MTANMRDDSSEMRMMCFFCFTYLVIYFIICFMFLFLIVFVFVSILFYFISLIFFSFCVQSIEPCSLV